MPYKYVKDKRINDKRYYEHRKEANGTAAPFAQSMVTIKVPMHKHGIRIAVIGDTQVKPGIPIDHLRLAGKYIAEKQPDVVIQIGDFCDLPSLSRHDEKGSLRLEGKRYRKDIDAVRHAMESFCNELAKVPQYKPKMLLTYGNHEDRITRTVNLDPKLEGLLSLQDLGYEEFGWTVFPFLQPIVVGGVAFCHYFPSGVMGKPINTAKTLLTKLHMSAYAGHQQGRDIAYAHRADGQDMTAIISGSFYQHSEEYLSPFTNNHWRGFYFLNEVKNGTFDEMALSIAYLKRRYREQKG